jgi:hypothetical protein
MIFGDFNENVINGKDRENKGTNVHLFVQWASVPEYRF